MSREGVAQRLQGANYLFFIFAVSLLATVNSLVILGSFLLERSDLFIQELGVLWIIDYVLAAILFLDFGMRLYSAPRRWHYFTHWGWLDFIGSIPALAIFRVVRMYLLSRELGRKGQRVILRELRRARASGAMLLIVWLVLIVLELSGVFVLAFEQKAGGANITNASDALWWGFQTITTVGYGDRYPVTDAGRLVGVALMTVGVGLFGTFTAWLADWFFGDAGRKADSAADADADAGRGV